MNKTTHHVIGIIALNDSFPTPFLAILVDSRYFPTEAILEHWNRHANLHKE